MKIRLYKETDFPMLLSWFKEANPDEVPTPDMIPRASTFILDLNGIPALSVSLIITNTSTAYVENFIGNPELKNKDRRESTPILLNHLAQVADKLGYTRLLCMAPNSKLSGYYQSIGFKPTLQGVVTLCMEVN